MSKPAHTEATRFMEALRARNRVALGRFYDEHVEAVSAVIWKVLGGHRDHEDIVQDTFYHAIEGVSGYRGDEHGLRAWVVQIAVHRCYRKLRHQRVRRWLVWTRDGDIDVSTPSSQDPHMSLALKRAYELLDNFPAEERVALSLRMFMHMTIPEIVEAMGRSRSTVKRLIDRGQARFLERARHDMILSSWCRSDQEVER